MRRGTTSLFAALDITANGYRQVLRPPPWLTKRPRWCTHLTSASASWPNQVECFLARLADKKR